MRVPKHGRKRGLEQAAGVCAARTAWAGQDDVSSLSCAPVDRRFGMTIKFGTREEGLQRPLEQRHRN